MEFTMQMGSGQITAIVLLIGLYWHGQGHAVNNTLLMPLIGIIIETLEFL